MSATDSLPQAQNVDPWDQLDERLDNPPKIWAPKGAPGDIDPEECIVEKTVKGVVEEVDTRTGDYGEYPVVVLVARDKARIQVAGFGTVLGNRLASVQIGDALGITYLGTKESATPGMQPYDNYDVVVLRNGKPAPRTNLSDSSHEGAEEAPAPDAPPFE